MNPDYFQRDVKMKPKVDKFVSEVINHDNELIKQTVGLVQLQDFQRIKEDIHQNSLPVKVKKYI